MEGVPEGPLRKNHVVRRLRCDGPEFDAGRTQVCQCVFDLLGDDSSNLPLRRAKDVVAACEFRGNNKFDDASGLPSLFGAGTTFGWIVREVLNYR